LLLFDTLQSRFGFHPLLQKPIRNLLESTCVQALGLIATYFIAQMSWRKISILRNDNPSVAALQREGDRDREKVVGEPSVEDLNRPWIVERKNKLPSNVDQFAKIWIMGRYKVGKTSLLNWLGVKTARPSNLDNTRGEIFYTSATWPRMLFVDTEGFDQPINVTEPEFRKRLVLTHAHKAADGIILVVPMLTLGDMTLFHRNINAMRNKQHNLFVVHNIQSVKSVVELRKYRDIYRSAYDLPNNAERPHQQQVAQRIDADTNVLVTTHGTIGGMSVYHYFLGDHDYLWNAWNRHQVKHLTQRVCGVASGGFPLIDTLRESLRLVGSSTYAFEGEGEVQCNVEVAGENEDEFYKLWFSQHITESLAREIGGNTVVGCTLDYKWLPARRVSVRANASTKKQIEVGVERRQRLLIGKSRVQIEGVDITDDTTVRVRFSYSNAISNLEEDAEGGGIHYNVISGFEVRLKSYVITQLTIILMPEYHMRSSVGTASSLACGRSHF
jgi:uncharacterized protein YifN (PemK superfamily)